MREPQFRLFGIPVRIAGSFLLVAVMGLTSGSVEIALVWVAVVFVTTLVHELGHAFAFRYYGRDSVVTLWGLGGLTQGEGPPLSRPRSIVVSLAGPIGEIILIGLPALYLARSVETTSATTALTLDLLVWVGVGWAIINLLPVIPLDGGRVLANVLEGAYGVPGARAARWIGMIVAAGAATYAVVEGYIFAAIFGLFFIAQNRNELHQLRDVPAAERLQEGHRLLDRGDASGAAAAAEEVAGASRNRLLAAAALHLLAWARLAEGRREDAAAALATLPEDVRPSRSIVAYTLALDGNLDEAMEVFVESMLEGEAGLPPNAQPALLLERAGRLDELVARLLAAPGEEGPNAVQVLASYLHGAGAYDASIRLDEKLFADGRADRGIAAYNAACSLARAGRPDDALGWLARATEAGFADTALLDSDDDLVPLRGDERFTEIRDRLRREART